MNSKERLFSIANTIKPVNKKKFYKIAENRLNKLIKPKGSLGRLEDFAKDVVAITEEERPFLAYYNKENQCLIINKYVCVFAGDHGVVEEGVSLFKQDVTSQMVRNFLSGGAAINAIAASVGAGVIVIDVGIKSDASFQGDNFISGKVKNGTFNLYKGPAMTENEAAESILKGIETADIVIKEKGAKICATGDMGIGNTTPASAITCFYSKKSPELVCGKGTGVSAAVIKKKAAIIKKAVESNIKGGVNGDAVDVLAGIGGLEIGAIAGFIIGCALNRTPVVVDGFISTAGALIALNINPAVADYMFMGHLSEEKGHKTAAALIGKTPILNLSMRLGEGTGAVIAMKIIETALNMYNNMLTFDEAGVIASKLNV
ncbi:MAG: nicotinate-nucleotide--dimethylbenzimidazole phosphoribosyltransferase [Deltaproteobacteria bacterium]|jgi:nicotinate-nucleotide--dimethylbenzimidazole phosphoribosyltransferase|nr:nicotinate-nucleotide--dimethylbenzimidazole phosphoribosyltransferase [Deltaproteobacteria bacterium]